MISQSTNQPLNTFSHLPEQLRKCSIAECGDVQPRELRPHSFVASHSEGFRGRKTACYSPNDDGIGLCASQRSAAVQVLVASDKRAAADRDLFRAVLALGHTVVRALPDGLSGFDSLAVSIGIQVGSGRVA